MDDAAVMRPLHPAVGRLLANPGRFVTPRGAQISLSYRYDRPVYFTINNRDDRIHKRQRKGFFYEEEILKDLAAWMPEGGTFADIGANVGNHSLYMLLFGGAATAMPFEMNPDAILLLVSNMVLNGVMDRVTADTLGYGLSDAAAEGAALEVPRGNLGWARVVPDGEGEVSLRPGDALVDGRKVDLLKMDVEGMEIAALNGLAQTIARDRPTLFVEVDHGNREAFDALMAGWGYRVERAFEPSRINQNLLLRPDGA